MGEADHRMTYAPLNTLKPVTDDVWIVDGPAIRFGPPLLKMPFPTRMTIIRLAGGRLFVHSPTHLTEELRAAVDKLGQVAFIIGPNRIHYWWVPYWRQAYPQAEVCLTPRVHQQAKGHIDFKAHKFFGDKGYPWDDEIATLPITGSFMTEVVFFHHASRTLVLTDLIENFEPEKLAWWMRVLTRIGGVQDPDGQMPRDMRLTFGKNRAGLKAAVEKMISWAPERVIIAHGRWYETDGTAELRRAFRWVLD